MEQTLHQGIYNIAATSLDEVMHDSWYHGFECLVCGGSFAVFNNKGEVERAVRMAGRRLFRVTCPHCQSDRLFSVDQITHFQHETSIASKKTIGNAAASYSQRIFRFGTASQHSPSLK